MTGKVIIHCAHLRGALHDALLLAALLVLHHINGVLVSVVHIIYHGLDKHELVISTIIKPNSG